MTTGSAANAAVNICVAITGASGSPYAMRLIEVLLISGCRVSVIISKAAQLVMATETDVKIPGQVRAQANYLREHFNATEEQLRVYGREDWMSPWASGSGRNGAMVICPCSTGTLSSVATGASNNLIERAADVALKERRQLILVPRETPFSTLHLQNMLTLSQMGAVILPASPGFYRQPESIEDLIDFVVARILNQLKIEHNLLPRWGE
ncbi:MAG: UbiX family flavin prenyltransferase [Oleispira sp.]|jgi:4-hydroxy-3-polyprenylbenzoate decarboxylase|nr:UbiX family flavin prenyltransferase [Oleispira sp.]